MIHVEHLSFTYPGADCPALEGVKVHLAPGEFALVCGPSGTGKSTFLRCLNGLVPRFSGGIWRGQVRIAGRNPLHESPRSLSRLVGFVFQDPEAQFVLDTVEEDILATLENADLPPAEIERRLDEVLDQLHIRHLRQRPIHTLSGGEQQKVAIASALALRPPILALDEPTSQLDPVAAADLLDTLRRLQTTLGLTVVLCEHRLERVLPYAQRILYFCGKGRVIQGTPQEVLPLMESPPPLIALALRLGWQPLPLSLAEAQQRMRESIPPAAPSNRNPTSSARQVAHVLPYARRRAPQGETPLYYAEGLCVRLGGREVLHAVDLELRPGEILALLGPNGAGKTTLLRALLGLQKPSGGRVFFRGITLPNYPPEELFRQVGYLPQDPNQLLFADSVYEELWITLHNHRLPPDQPRVNALLEQLGLREVAERYPRDLSVGQRQRVALGAILVTRPLALLLDEPTRGMDALAKRGLVALLKAWRDEGKAILVATHDVELAAECADRVALLEEGRLKHLGPAAQVLPTLGEHAPQIAQLFPAQGWLTVPQALRGLGLA